MKGGAMTEVWSGDAPDVFRSVKENNRRILSDITKENCSCFSVNKTKEVNKL